jgi:hypothetical protein
VASPPETQPRPTHPGLEIFPDPDGKVPESGLAVNGSTVTKTSYLRASK